VFERDERYGGRRRPTDEGYEASKLWLCRINASRRTDHVRIIQVASRGGPGSAGSTGASYKSLSTDGDDRS
jgi:hypothetical protein